MRYRKFKKNRKKIQKIKKYHYDFISSKEGWKSPRKRENRNFRSNPTRNRKFQKNSKKLKKYHYGFLLSQNRLEKAEKERK